MDLDARRKKAAILSVIAEAGSPLGSSKIAEELKRRGIVLKGRMVRYYLEETDRLGFTENLYERERFEEVLAALEGKEVPVESRSADVPAAKGQGNKPESGHPHS